MIEYLDIIGKRVIISIVEDKEITLIPGVATLDEDNYMFEVFPDESVMEEPDPYEVIGIGCETFENDIIKELDEDHQLRKKYNAEFVIILR